MNLISKQRPLKLIVCNFAMHFTSKRFAPRTLKPRRMIASAACKIFEFASTFSLTGIASHISKSLREFSEHLSSSCRKSGRGGGGRLKIGGDPGPQSLSHSMS